EDGIRDRNVTGVQTCALPISADLVRGCVQSSPMMTNEVGSCSCFSSAALFGSADFFDAAGAFLGAGAGAASATFVSESAPIISRSEERRVGKGCSAVEPA